jgi:Mlc titration factor MtfA (ptsG expression regulator)
MRFRKEKRREKLRSRPFPEAWDRLLLKNVPLFRRLPPVDREELHGHIHVFLEEKHFSGCGGLEITEEIRLVVAAQACVLLLHRDTDYYPELASILVYPSTYVAPAADVRGGIVNEYEEERSGETWEQGSLVLSWDDVAGTAVPLLHADEGHRGGNGRSHDKHAMRDALTVSEAREELEGGRAAREKDEDEEVEELVPAFNVVLHEFAHQLDLENGEMDGVPRLASKEHYDRWTNVFADAFDKLDAQLDDGIDPVIDDYAAEDDVEFFAVATESFFETPFALRDEFPEVFDELRSYYRQDPTTWLAESELR